jgi:predicted nucleic acid-binding protein
MAWYVDTSAFLKLVKDEKESQPLKTWCANDPQLVSSQLLLLEARRACQRLEVSEEDLFSAIDIITLMIPNMSTYQKAAEIRPLSLRSLDALHVATAFEVGSELEGIVTYDQRMAEAARINGLVFISPN